MDNVPMQPELSDVSLDIPRMIHDKVNHEYVAERKKEELTRMSAQRVSTTCQDGREEPHAQGGNLPAHRYPEILARAKANGLKVCANTNGCSSANPKRDSW
jgi:hypothetical protein